jgi:hypothetical protein
MNNKSFHEELKSLDREYSKNVQTIFKRAIKPLFEQYPNVNGVSWLQYTPYFCDGDPCYFQMYADIYYGLLLKFDDSEYEDYENLLAYRRESVDDEIVDDEELRNVYKAFEDFLYTFTSEQMERIIPDEGRVYLARDGAMSVESYEHD